MKTNHLFNMRSNERSFCVTKMLFVMFITLYIGISPNADSKSSAMPQNEYISSKVKSKTIMCTSTLSCRSPLVARFYTNRNYAPAWISSGQLTQSGVSLVFAVRNSYLDGLNPYAYHVTMINDMIGRLRHVDSRESARLLADLDVTLTDAFFLMAEHLSNGIVPASQVSSHLTFHKKNINFIDVANKAVKANDVAEVLGTLAPRNLMYTKLKEKLYEYYKIEAAPNTQVAMQIQKIALNMDRLRILPEYMGSRYVIINIPNYSLDAYRDGKLFLTMPVVVGKPSRPSCILNGRISQVEFNPYWNVPNSIAGDEIIPELRHNPGFLRENNVRVFRNNNSMTEVNPDSIDWDSASTSEYKFRQDPGDGNALGKVKFAFANPCGMYLHDSLAHELFEADARDLSHGCIRLGKPLNFAYYLLGYNKGWDKDQIMAAVNNGERRIVPLASQVDLYILYQTLLVNSAGELIFRNDIYNLDRLSPYPVWTGVVKDN